MNDAITLEAVPNVSEGRDAKSLEAISRALAHRGCRLLDLHSDPDYGRSVFTLVGEPQALADALLACAKEVMARIDIRARRGVHPCIGALDVVPIAYLRSEDRETARDEALAVANRLAGELDLPVFLYGELASAPERRERAFFREGGVSELGERLAQGELEPDFGPARLHPTAGAVLVSARPPLVAFNIELEGCGLDGARAIAARVRERGSGLPGVRAIGVRLDNRGTVELSTNVHDPFQVPLSRLVETVRSEAGGDGATVAGAELVGVAPAAAFQDFPADVPLRGFDEHRHILENRLGSPRGRAR